MYTTNNTSSLTADISTNVPVPTELSFAQTQSITQNETQIQEYTSPSGLNFEIPISSSTTVVDAITLSDNGYELSNQTNIPNQLLTTSFTPGENYVEFYVYDAQKSLLSSNYKWEDWTILKNSNREQLSQSYVDNTTGLKVIEKPSTTVPTDQIYLSPSSNVYNQGFENGILYASYNFVNYELGSSPNNSFYLDEISSDRTEIAIRSNTIPKNDISRGYKKLQQTISSAKFFDEFYVSFFDNEYLIGVNVLLTSSIITPSTTNTLDVLSTDANENLKILIKLYEPLPPQFQLKDNLYVASKVGESKAYKIEYDQDLSGLINQANFIQGPNINIPLKDLVNNSTELKSYEDLVNTPSSESLNNLLNVLNKTGVTITPNYSYNTFNEFINFSSAKERVNNFYEKVSQIQSYEADIETITKTTGSNPNVTSISTSLASLQTNISNLVKNFDGYETYLYNNSSSFAYPKTGSAYPYLLKPTGSTEVLEWMGSDVENSQYYGGYVLSASLYDENNQNWLYYTIPDFIKENSSNDEYIEFSNMVGQSFDEIWIYTKALSERYNTTNDPNSGLPLGLAADAIKGLGFETFGNNYNNQDNFIGLTGEDNGSYVPPTGSELITQYIAVNGGQVYNYWSDGYAWANYVQSITEPGFPYAIDKVSKEIFKRLYHNMAYLTKKKGTISGLRQLINIWGIPNTILRINEYGGKNRDNSNDYDLWYDRFSYAYTPVANSYVASSSVNIPWMPLERNKIASDLNTTLSPNIVYTTFTGTITNGGTLTAASTGFYQIDRYFTKTGNGQYGGMLLEAVNGEINLSANPGQLGVYVGNPSTGWPSFSTNGEGINYQIGDQITITGAQINQLNDVNLGQGWTGTITLTLTNLNVQGESGGYIVPDGLAFRFKTTGFPSSSFGGSYYSQSLAVKKSNGINNDEFDFGIGLYYEDQPSGSYSGSSNSDYYEYGKMRFYISASTAQGGVMQSEDIFLPFFNKGWWSVILQRNTHVSASVNDASTMYTLQVANKQYDGDDGNVIGWTGSVSMSTGQGADFGYGYGEYGTVIYGATGVTSSANEAWNNFGVTEVDGIYLGGYVSGSNVVTKELNEIGKIFSGSFQEFRYYSNDIPTEVFHDFTMNPESVEGNNITGSESSFDIVNFRAPLGNELEYLYTSSQYGDYIDPISSSHPAITGSALSLITGSFVNPANNTVTSSYNFIHYSSSAKRTYSKPNTEVYLLDQPSIGVRNRVSNKIQVEDGDAYGKVLSRQVSIDQNYLISESYTEDVTNFEVAFSPQDEVNDDIIATFGYGVVSDTLGDPRFLIDSKRNYYPRLRDVAIDYFKKYTEGNVYDYLRLIKYFDNSLFKAVKAYVPARTSVSTGVVIKQNLLERNRRPSVTITPNTTVSRTIETGSFNGNPTNQTGLNSAIEFRNLEFTGSIDVESIEGGAGGVPNNLNTLQTQSAQFIFNTGVGPGIISGEYRDFINISQGGSVGNAEGSIKYIEHTPSASLKFLNPVKTRFSINKSSNSNPLLLGQSFTLAISSSIRGIIGTEEIGYNDITPIGTKYYTNFYTFTPQEEIGFLYKGNFGLNNFRYYQIQTEDFLFVNPHTSSVQNQVSSQSYIERNETVLGSVFGVKGSQDEFYNGEYSGSEFLATTQSFNPYRLEDYRDTRYFISASSGLRFETQLSSPFYYEVAEQLNDRLGTMINPNELDIMVAGGGGGPDQAFSNFSKYLDEGWVKYGRNAISLYKTNPTVIPNQSPIRYEQRYFIAGIFIHRRSANGTDHASTVLPNVDLNQSYPSGKAIYGNSPYVGTPNNPQGRFRITGTDPIDPTYYQTFITASLIANNSVATLDPNPLSPIFNFSILYSDTSGFPSPTTDFFLNYNMGADSSLSGNDRSIIPSNRIQSALFNNDPSSIGYYVVSNGAIPTSAATDFSPHGLAIINPKNANFLGEQANTNGATSYLSIDVGNIANFANPEIAIIQNIDLTVPYGLNGRYLTTFAQSEPSFVSTYQVSKSLAIDKARGNTPGYLYGQDSGSLFQYRQTFLGFESPDTYAYTPLTLALNKFTEEPLSGDILNNQATFLTDPTFNFELSGSLFAPTSVNIVNREFYQGLTDREGPFITSGNINSNNYYWIYGSGSRVTSNGVYNYNPSSNLMVPYAASISQSLQLFNFNPNIAASPIIFDNSPFNPIINNVTGSEKNTYVKEVEYQNGINLPSNLPAIINDTALPAPVNDSFYTTNANIIPRYLGSTLQSANYNNFTPSGSEITFLNAMEGSDATSSMWGGDNSFGNTSVIDKYPVYFAHFKSSYNNLNLEDTYTFEIDSLILSPNTNITGDKAPITPITIKVDGSGKNLINVSSTFELGRKVGVAYDSSIFNKINYANLPIGDKLIFQGSLEMDTIGSTTLGPTGRGEYSFPLNTPTMSFQTASFSNDYEISRTTNLTSAIPSGGDVYRSSQGMFGASNLRSSYLVSSFNCFWLGGSKINFDNFLYGFSSGGGTNNFMANNFGPGLAMINSFNCAVSESITGSPVPFQSSNFSPTPTAMTYGIPTILSQSFATRPELIDESRNYFIQNYTASNVAGFKEDEGGVPFIIKVGDEIVVTFDTQKNKGASISGTNFVTQEFLVTGIDGIISPTQTPNYEDFTASYCDASQCILPGSIPVSNANGFLKNKINVTPNPQDFNIPGFGAPGNISGRIDSFVIRRRTEADDRVIIYQSPPTTFGINETTGSGGGYLIPDDFSPIQKRNALTLINQLKSKNAFRDDSQLPDFKE